jgi:hypothetical protein
MLQTMTNLPEHVEGPLDLQRVLVVRRHSYARRLRDAAAFIGGRRQSIRR